MNIDEVRRVAIVGSGVIGQHGELGIKSGKGFYTYPDPAFERPDFFDG